MTQLGDEEVWVQACMQQALPDVRIAQHDDGSRPSMYDLRLTYSDGTPGAVEITAAADAQQLELWKLVGGRGTRWIEPDLVGGWQVRILPSTRAKTLRQQLPGLLRALEQAHTHIIWGDSASPDRLAALAAQLSIVQAQQTPTAHPGSIYVMPPEKPLEQMGGFSPVIGDPFAKWLSAWIIEPSRTDNLHKLDSSGAQERLLFVLVPGFNRAPFAVNDLLMAPGSPLPTIPPDLPDAITHVWVMGTWSTGDGFWWSPDKDWTLFTKVTPSSTEANSAGQR